MYTAIDSEAGTAGLLGTEALQPPDRPLSPDPQRRLPSARAGRISARQRTGDKTMADLPGIDDSTRTEIESAVFRQLIEHLQKYPEVQNIDLMNLAYFCRNCISKWYRSAAADRGIELDYDQAREIVYGMPYPEYKERFQEKATPEQLESFRESEKKASV
jgi:hypothetical protein